MRFLPFTTDVPNAGTRVQIENSTQKVRIIHFHGRTGNTGNVYAGDDTVSASAGGREIKPDAWVTIDFGEGTVPMNTFYVDAATNGDDVDGFAILV